MNSLCSHINNYKPPVFPKGKFDHIFIFICEYLCRLHEFGPASGAKGGVGEIPVPETVAMNLFYDYYYAVEDARPPSTLNFMIEQAFCRLTCGEERRTEQELMELVLMKTLLGYCMASTWENIINGVSDVRCLLSFLCSDEVRGDITTKLIKLESKLREENGIAPPENVYTYSSS
jgi:hypothetical protein